MMIISQPPQDIPYKSKIQRSFHINARENFFVHLFIRGMFVTHIGTHGAIGYLLLSSKPNKREQNILKLKKEKEKEK